MTARILIAVRFDNEIVQRMDKVIKTRGYDSKASFIRKAVFEKLNEEEGKFLA